MSRRIMLADDSVTIQKVVELTFMDEDYEVTAVSNGSQALAQLAVGDLPDVLIADVHMPGASGYEVCRRAKELDASLPVLLLVGTFEPFDREAMVAAGGDGFLKKPFDSQELLRLVQDLLAKRPIAVPPPVSEAIALEAQVEMTEAAAGATVAAPVPAAEPSVHPTIGFDWRGAEAAPPAGAPSQESAASSWAAAPPSWESAPALAAEPVAESAVAQPAPDFEEEPAASAVAASPPPVAVSDAAEESAASSRLSDAEIDRIARRLVELVGEKVVREIAWEVLPDLAEVVLKARIRELEAQVE